MGEPMPEQEKSGSTWPYTESEMLAADHGFTEAQYRAARRIEYIIFGREWVSQGDRAATMFVEVMQALKDQADAAANGPRLHPPQEGEG